MPHLLNYSENTTNIWNDRESACTHAQFSVRGTTLAIFSIGGVMCNGFLLLAILPNRRLRNVRHLCLIHLALTGIISSLITVSMSAATLIYCEWIGGPWFCQLYSFLFSVLVFSSVWTIATLSWDKYQTIASPLHHSQTTTFVRIVFYIMVMWLAATLLSLPPLVGAGSYALRIDMAMCVVDVINHDDVNWYPFLYLALWYFVPFTMLTYCYFHIFRIARSQSSRIAASMFKMGSMIQAPIKLAQTQIKGRRAMCTILYIIGAFTITFLPFAAMLLVEIFTHRASNTTIVTVVTSLIQAAPMVNAIVYGIRNRILRESFVSFFSTRSPEANEVRCRRRGHGDDFPPRPSSTLRLSVLLRKCAAGPNLPLSPASSRRGFIKQTNLTVPDSARDATDINYNGELVPMWLGPSVSGVLSTPRHVKVIEPYGEEGVLSTPCHVRVIEPRDGDSFTPTHEIELFTHQSGVLMPDCDVITPNMSPIHDNVVLPQIASL